MYELLEHNLRRWVGPERYNLVIDALKALEAHGYMSPWTQISLYLEEDNSDTIDVVLSTIEGLIDLGLDAVLRAHTIEMDGAIALRTTVLNALLLITQFDDTESIINCTTESINPVESFCNLLGIVTTQEWIHFIDSVKSVSPRLIEKINLDANNREANQPVDLQSIIDARRKKLLIKLKSMHPDALGIIKVVDECFPVGEIDIDTIVQMDKLYLMSLEPELYEKAAVEIMSLVLISYSPVDDLLKTCKDQYDIIFGSFDFITKVDIAMTNLFTEVNRDG